MKVKYTGTSDFRELGAADFKKAGIENQKKIVFAQGEVTEVDDEVGKALIANEGLFQYDDFEEVTDEEQPKAGVEEQDAADDKQVDNESGTVQESTGDAAAPAEPATSTTSTTGTRGSRTR